MTRRHLLGIGAALPAFSSESNLVAELPAPRIQPRDFSDPDLDLPYYAAHFARLANSVRLNAPHRGFIDLSVWRRPGDNRPYNARIMENILSLAWFYTTVRKWNPYRGDPALRARLEAALDFWTGMQGEQGHFSEYSDPPKGWNLAATSFAAKFMAEALRLLQKDPSLDAGIHRRAIDGCRKAIRVVLYDEQLYSHGRAYTNQFTNIFAAAPAFLELYPDKELEVQFDRRMRDGDRDFLSPCGYFYEADGPDFGYNLGTHHENVRMMWHYLRKSKWAEMMASQEQRFCEWLAYNTMPEPGAGIWALNRSIECRQRKQFLAPFDTPPAERAGIARAFAIPPDERTRRTAAARSALEASWPQVRPLPVGEFWAYSPYAFLHRSHFEWHAAADQIAAARRGVRSWSDSNPYIHQRADSRKPYVFTYVRQPAYYAAFAAGIPSRQQRLGLTFLWSPSAGAVLQRQTGDAGESGPVEAAYQVAGATVTPQPGATDCGRDGFRIRSESAGVRRTLEFRPQGVEITLESPGDIVETLPMLVASEDPSLASGGVSTAGWRIRTDARASCEPSREPLFAAKRLCPVTLRGAGTLRYTLVF